MRKVGYGTTSLWCSIKELFAFFKGYAKYYLLCGLTIIIIIILNSDNSINHYLRQKSLEIIPKVYSVINKPIDMGKCIISSFHSHFKVMEQNQQLKQENLKLQAHVHNMEKQLNNYSSLKSLLHVVEPLERAFITTKILTKNFTPLEMNYIVNANNDIKLNQIAMTSVGIVGRVVEIEDNNARILSIYDAKSRIPVFFNKSGCNAILYGTLDLQHGLKVQHLNCNMTLPNDDIAITSGIGGIFPHGLRVGQVKYYQEKPYVLSLVNHAELDYVVLF